MDKKHVEAALFVAKTPMTVEELAKVMDEDESVVLRWIVELKAEYEGRGMIIKQVAGGFEMVSNPDCVHVVEQIVPKQYEGLSRSAEETLAIVAYNQPVKRAYIAKLRGVLNPDHGLSSLLDRHLIRETEEGFVTTEGFLRYYAINDLKELPVLAHEANEAVDEHVDVTQLEEEKEAVLDQLEQAVSHKTTEEQM